MASNGLFDPLGQEPKNRRRAVVSPRLLAVLVIVLSGSALAVLARLRDDGGRGEPFAVSTIVRVPSRAELPAAPAPPPPLSGVTEAAPAAVAAATPADQQVDVENGVKVIRGTAAAASGTVVLKVPAAEHVALAAAPDPRLVEPGPFGLLPRVGANGARPADVYARPSSLDRGAQHRAKVALVVGGMGLDRSSTAAASKSLPGTVTFGFAPYGEDLDAQVRQARDAGHEVVLQLPMEDFGSPEAGPSHMLLSGEGGNVDRLRWLMSRFSGYAGVANYLGGRFLADEGALAPVMRDVAARGLFFLEDGLSPRSLAASVGAEIGCPSVRADVVLDAKGGVSASVAFDRLESAAREHGSAVAMASALPETMSILPALVERLHADGLELVPLSAVVRMRAADLSRAAPPRSKAGP